MSTGRFDPDTLIAQACEAAGSDDFGEPDGWRDGLALLADGLASESYLNDLGVEIAVMDIVGPLRPGLSDPSSSSASHAPAPPSCSTCSPRTRTCGPR